MKVLIAYPPLPSEKGSPMLSQNRQFQWFSEPSPYLCRLRTRRRS
jgi:hypothetical protein